MQACKSFLTLILSSIAVLNSIALVSPTLSCIMSHHGESTPFSRAFPEDLERLIFEEAANCDLQTMIRIVLVAKRVQRW